MDVSFLRPLHISKVVKIKPLPLGENAAKEDVFFQEGLVQLHDPTAPRSEAPSEYRVNFVYGPLSTGEDVAQREVPLMTEAALQGTDSVLLVLGSDGSGKSSIVDGRRGVTGFTLQRLYTMLQEEKARNAQDPQTAYATKLTMKYFEMSNEYITDLLVDHPQPVQVADTPDGVVLKGLSGMTISNPQDALDALDRAQKKRNQAQKARASTAFMLEATQADTRQGWALFARLLVVESAALDCLSEDRDAVQLREGFQAYRSIYNLQNVAQQWQPGHAGEVNSAILTWLLRDAFSGGSVNVTALLCLQQLQHKVSKGGLDLLKNLGKIEVNPVSVNHQVAGLSRAFRGQWLQARSALAAVQKYEAATELEEAAKKQIHDLEGKLIEQEVGRIKAVEDCGKLRHQAEIMKEQYRDALTKQAETQKKLIEVEENRLKVCQALVTLQLQQTQQQDESSEKQYQQDTKVIAMEQDVADLRIENRTLSDRAKEFEQELETTEDARKGFEMELLATRKNLISAKEDLETEKKKNEELSLEIIHATNREESLQQEYDKIKEKRGEEMQGEASLLKSIEESKKSEKELQQKCHELEAKLNAETSLRMKREVEIESLGVKFEKEQTEVEKSVLEQSKERDGELIDIQKQTRAEREKTAGEMKSVMDKLEDAQKQIRSLQRSNTELQKQVELAKQAEKQAIEVGSEAEDDLTTLREEFQRVLGDLAVPDGNTDTEAVLSRMSELARLNAAKEREHLAARKKATMQSRALEDSLVFATEVALDWAPESGEDATKEKLRSAVTIAQASVDAKVAEQGSMEQHLLEQNRVLRADLEAERQALAQIKVQHTKDLRAAEREQAQKEVELLELRKFKEESESSGSISQIPELGKVQQRLLTEVQALRRGETAEDGSKELLEKNRALQAKVERLQAKTPAEQKAMQQRMEFLDRSIKDVEAERSELLVRATVAEEQLSQLQKHLTELTGQYQTQIVQLKRQLQGR